MPDQRILAIVLGAIIGYAAAQHRGYAPIAGILVGAWLGPLFACLLFLIDGVVRSHERVRCSHCHEWMKPEATVCPHCGRGVPVPPSPHSGGPRLVFSRRD
jgi:hypothetical protein